MQYIPPLDEAQLLRSLQWETLDVLLEPQGGQAAVGLTGERVCRVLRHLKEPSARGRDRVLVQTHDDTPNAIKLAIFQSTQSFQSFTF